MIKFTADGPKGRVLFLGVSDRNVSLLLSGRPIKIIGAEVGCDHDIYIFHGATEQAMVDMLLANGVKLPSADKVHTHHDDDRQESGEH